MGLNNYPAPEWTSRDDMEVPAPGSVGTLATRARSLGWDVRVQCSRGARPHGVTGKPLGVKTYWAVIMSFDGGRHAAYAVRDDTSWVSVMLWGRERPFFPLATITDLNSYIDARGEVDGAWIDAVRVRVAGAEERTKARAACNRGSHADVETIGCVAWCSICMHSWPVKAEPWKAAKRGKDFASCLLRS